MFDSVVCWNALVYCVSKYTEGHSRSVCWVYFMTQYGHFHEFCICSTPVVISSLSLHSAGNDPARTKMIDHITSLMV